MRDNRENKKIYVRTSKNGLILQYVQQKLTFMAWTTASGFCAAGRYPVTGGGRSSSGICADPCRQMDTHSSRSKITHIALSDYQKWFEHCKSPRCFTESTKARNGLKHLIITHLCLDPLHGYTSTKNSFSAWGLVSPCLDTALWVPF